MQERDFGREIAEAGFSVEAITLSPKNPYTWVSGIKSPIYNDNRKLLSVADYRVLTTWAFDMLIARNNLKFDMIGGTSTAGIAPATSLALHYQKPLVILKGKYKEGAGPDTREPYMFNIPLLNEMVDREDRELYGGVATTVPFSIPSGVAEANFRKLPFMYIRREPKDHGLGNEIEGVPKPGQKVMLIDNYLDPESTYTDVAVTSLEAVGVEAKSIISIDISDIVTKVDVNGKRILYVEDLMSMSKSAGLEMVRMRELGATADDLIAIFSYGLDEAAANLRKANVNAYPILTFDKMLETGIRLGKIDAEGQDILKEWREIGPRGWDAKYGQTGKM